MKGKFHSKSSNDQPIRNQQSLSVNVDDETDNENLEQPIASDLQPPNEIEGQITDEVVEDEIHDLMMQEDSVPFCFEAFHFIKQNLRNISQEKEEQPVGCLKISMDTSQQSSQVFDDPISDVLDDVCSQSLSPLTLCKVETCADIDLIR